MNKKIFLVCFCFQSIATYAQIDSLQKLLSETKNDTLRVILLNDLAWEYAYLDADKAQNCAEKALNIAQKSDFRRGEAISYGMLGVVKDIQGKSQEALSFYLKELEIEEKLGNKTATAGTLTNIGALHFNQEQFEQARKYFERSLAIEKETKNDLGALGSLINLGVINKNLQNFEQAERLLEEARLLNQKVQDEQQQAYIWANLASIALAKDKQTHKAIEYFEKAIEINQKTGNQLALAIAYNGLSEANRLANRLPQALVYAQNALDVAQKLQAQKQIQASYFNLAQAYEKMGEYAQAYKFFQQHTEVKEKLINEANYKQIAEAEAKFESEAQKRVIVEKEVALQRTERNLWLISGVLVLFLVIVGLLLGLFRTKQKHNIVLQAQKKTIEKALKDREVLLQEIHHRVKNNLQIVSSLLNLQSRQAKDHDTSEAIRQATNRVKSMALLHQNLYQNENLQLVNAQEYIGQLIKNLVSAYQNNTQFIEIEKNIDELHLDIDLMMPLGLILNEWLTNAFKYAFPDERKGKININCKKENKQLILQVVDNGVGFEKKNINSFGSSLVEMLAEKLEAELTYNQEGGTKCRLKITFLDN